MEKLQDLVSNASKKQIIMGGLAAFGLAFLLKKLRSSKKRKNYPRDVVILHEIGSAPGLPSASPFVMKLQTFLRMANIKYQNEPDALTNRSRAGKFPWISYNDEDIDDSQFSIEYLKKKFNVNLDSDYSLGEVAAGRAFRRTLEEATFWGLALSRTTYQIGSAFFKKMGIKSWQIWLLGRMVTKRAKAQGTGLHSQDKVMQMTIDDYRSISQFLGNKKYFLGESPSEVDATIFGFVTQLLYTFPDSDYDRISKDEFKNLYDYCERMKERFWPDWNDCIRQN